MDTQSRTLKFVGTGGYMKPIVLAAAVLLLAAIPPQRFYAQAGEARSNAVISFEAEGGRPNIPVNPDNPSRPHTEDDTEPAFSRPIAEGGIPLENDLPENDGTAGITGAAGGLVLDYVTPFFFGTTDANDQCRLQDFTNTVPRPYLQVTDRRDNGQGWKVTAVAGAAASVDATILLEHGSPLSAYDRITPPIADQTVRLVMDGRTEQPVLSARRQTGMLTWVNRWYPVGGSGDVAIRFMPCCNTGVLAEAYILWSLHDAP